ncbi:hypothetical protein BH10ACT1_BH10ACT1_25340 [soil metagenome]
MVGAAVFNVVLWPQALAAPRGTGRERWQGLAVLVMILAVWLWALGFSFAASPYFLLFVIGAFLVQRFVRPPASARRSGRAEGRHQEPPTEELR